MSQDNIPSMAVLVPSEETDKSLRAKVRRIIGSIKYRFRLFIYYFSTPIGIIRLVGFFVFLSAIVIAKLGFIHQYSGNFVPNDAVGDFYANISTELASIAITIIVIDALNEWRQNRELKQQLIRDMASADNGLAIRASRELEAHGWLSDGSLKEAYLFRANLENAILKFAMLKKANLRWAKLKGVNLINSNLQETYLLFADLSEAIFGMTNLSNAHLYQANLSGAHIGTTNFREASLVGANLSNAKGASTTWGITDFSGADLSNANLTNADLTGANLSSANLTDAILKGCYLNEANLTDARINNSQLKQAKSLKNATMPDGSKYEVWVKHQSASNSSKVRKGRKNAG